MNGLMKYINDSFSEYSYSEGNLESSCRGGAAPFVEYMSNHISKNDLEDEKSKYISAKCDD